MLIAMIYDREREIIKIKEIIKITVQTIAASINS